MSHTNNLPSAAPVVDEANVFKAELNFHEAWLAHQYAHPAIREAACLAAQYPACLSPIEPSDRFAGRYYATPGVGKPVREHRGYQMPWHAMKYNMPALGFAALRPGWGSSTPYFFDERILNMKMEEAKLSDPSLLNKLEDLIAFWREHSPVEVCLDAMPQSLKDVLPFTNLDSAQTAHPAYPLIRMTGPMLDFEKLIVLGIPGMREEIQHLLSESTNNDSTQLYRGMLMSLDVLSNVCIHYANQSRSMASNTTDTEVSADMLKLAVILEQLPSKAPDGLRGAMQLVLLYATLSTAYSFGRMDDYLGNLLEQDLSNATITEKEALSLVISLWQIIADCGAPFDNRIIIGGAGRKYPAQADRFARLALEATRLVKEPLPQLSLRFDPESSGELYALAMTSLSEGRTFPLLYNDRVNIPAVAKAMDVPLQDAEQYVPYGCGEYVLYKKSFGTPSGVINLTKVLECVLRNGEEKLSGRTIGLPMGRLEDFKTFEDLWHAYASNVEYWVTHLAEQQKWEYDYVGANAGWLYFSILYEDCLQRGRNLFAGGIHHLGGTLEAYGQINAADSLTAINELVFRQRKIATRTLMQALDQNFQDAEDIRRLLVNAPKYGNDDTIADLMQVRVHKHLCHTTRNQAARVGLDSYLVVIINNLMNTILGRNTLASADGRLSGSHLANANNPAPGMDRAGTTAFLNSLLKLDPTIHAGAVQNMKFGRDYFTPALRPKLDAMLGVYWREGGTQAMMTVLARDDLEAALHEPEKYPNLMVRVGGFSARFVELPKDVQREVLARTLN